MASNKIYGYCRISTSKQKIERQVTNIERAYPQADIRQEVYTGTKLQGREVFKKLLKDVKPGDTIVFDSVSRMSRNADEGFKTYLDLYNKGINLIFLKESTINTSVYKSVLGDSKLDVDISTGDKDTDRFIDDIMTAVSTYITKLTQKQIIQAFEQAQKEVDDLHTRVSEGLRDAKKRGSQVGRIEGKQYTSKKSIAVKELILKYCRTFGTGTLNDIDTLAIINGQSNLNCSRNSYYKYKRELIAEMSQQA